MKKLTLAQKLRNPATRSKIPTSQLPARYQKMRAANTKRAQLDDPNALTQPLTPRLLNQQVQSATNLNFGEADRDLQSRQAQAAQTQASIPQWFSDYQAALQHATDTTKAAYAAAGARQQNATDSTYNLDTAAAGQQQQAMQADAATRGATVDPAVAAMAQQAALSRRSAGDIQTGLTSALGAANVSYRGGQQAVGAAQQLVAQRDQANRQGALGQESKDLAAKKGDYAVTTRQKLIDSEHTKQLENKAYGLNAEKAAADIAATGTKLKLDAKGLQLKQAAQSAQNELNAAKLTNDQQRIQIAQQNADAATKRANSYASGRGPGGSKKLGAVQGTARKDIDYAKAQIAGLRKHVGAHKVPARDSQNRVIPNKFVTELDKNGNPVTRGGKPPTDAQIRAALENGEGPLRSVPPAAIDAAMALLDPTADSLTPKQIAALRATYPNLSLKALGYPTPGHRRKVKRATVRPDIVGGGYGK